MIHTLYILRSRPLTLRTHQTVPGSDYRPDAYAYAHPRLSLPRSVRMCVRNDPRIYTVGTYGVLSRYRLVGLFWLLAL